MGRQKKRAGKHGEPDFSRNIVARRLADPHHRAGRNLYIAHGNIPGQLDTLQQARRYCSIGTLGRVIYVS